MPLSALGDGLVVDQELDVAVLLVGRQVGAVAVVDQLAVLDAPVLLGVLGPLGELAWPAPRRSSRRACAGRSAGMPCQPARSLPLKRAAKPSGAGSPSRLSAAGDVPTVVAMEMASRAENSESHGGFLDRAWAGDVPSRAMILTARARTARSSTRLGSTSGTGNRIVSGPKPTPERRPGQAISHRSPRPGQGRRSLHLGMQWKTPPSSRAGGVASGRAQ